MGEAHKLGYTVYDWLGFNPAISSRWCNCILLLGRCILLRQGWLAPALDLVGLLEYIYISVCSESPVRITHLSLFFFRTAVGLNSTSCFPNGCTAHLCSSCKAYVDMYVDKYRHWGLSSSFAHQIPPPLRVMTALCLALGKGYIDVQICVAFVPGLRGFLAFL